MAAAAQAELTEWIESISASTEVDLNQYIPKLLEHGLTKFLMHDVHEDDWVELIECIGHRRVLQQAADEMFSKAELVNLKAVCDRTRNSSEELAAEGDTKRSQLQRIQADLQQVDGNLINAKREFFAASSSSSEQQSQLSALQSELATLKAEVDSLTQEIVTVQQQKEDALKAKEAAINQAVEFGVSGGRPAQPPAQPQQTQQSAVPPGYSFQQPPPQQQQQQQPPQPQQQTQPVQQFQQPPPQQQEQAAVTPAEPMYQQSVAPPQQQQQQQWQQPAQQQQPPPQQQQQNFQRVDPNAPIESYPWYHGNISRESCESKLASGGPGDFMVRKSARGNNSYSLSVMTPNGPKHYKIENSGQAWNLALRNPDNKKFQTIAHLINHYVANPPTGAQLQNPAMK